jgi:hypothetical protein
VVSADDETSRLSGDFFEMELAGLEPATSWVRSNPEGRRADTGGEESPVWSQLSLFPGPANDGRS